MLCAHLAAVAQEEEHLSVFRFDHISYLALKTKTLNSKLHLSVSGQLRGSSVIGV